MVESITIGQRLKELRGSRPQIEVARAVGITTMALSQYETDKRTPRDGIKVRLADYYKVSVESLFFNKE